MLTYKRIMTAIDLGDRGIQVARRALHLARSCGAELLICHVVDYTPGFESDHYPFLTPQEMMQTLATTTRETLDAILDSIGAHDAQARVAVGRARDAVIELAEEWRADLVVVGSHATYGLSDRRGRPTGAASGQEFDVLTLQTERRGLKELLRVFHVLPASAQPSVRI